LLVAGASACDQSPTGTIRLQGTISGLGNDTIYLYGADHMRDHIDTLLVRRNTIDAVLSVDTLLPAYLLFSDGTQCPIILNKTGNLKLKGSAAELPYLQITGNQPNNELTAFRQSLQGLAEPSEKKLQERAEAFVNTHPASLASLYLLDNYFVQKPFADIAHIRTLIDRMSGELKDRPYLVSLLKRIQEEERSQKGRMLPLFKLRNPEGKELTRNNFNEQYLLIHFWASWDTLRTDTTLQYYRRLYRKEKKNKQFALLGISLDTNKKAWEDAIQKDSLQWEQVCDFTGWNSDLAQQLAIRTLPYNLLVSPSGRIEERQLDQQAIHTQLKEIEKQETERLKREKERKHANKNIRSRRTRN
jgi:peroxiredoxin